MGDSGDMAFLPPHTADLLTLTADADMTGDLWWNTTTEGGLRFFLSCSDTFAWATADCEEVRPSDMDLLRQTLADLRECDPKADIYTAELYASRKRGMRPMRLWLGNHPGQESGDYKGSPGLTKWCPEALPLFLAVGPERDPRSEG